MAFAVGEGDITAGLIIADHGGGDTLARGHALGNLNVDGAHLETLNSETEFRDRAPGTTEEDLARGDHFKGPPPSPLPAHVADELEPERLGAHRDQLDAEGFLEEAVFSERSGRLDREVL